MRLDNVPEAVGITVLGVLAYFIGFPAALPWGIGTYLLALGALVVYVMPFPAYDHATPVPTVFGIFSLTMTVALIYIFIRLWLWAPAELWFLRDQSWLGAILTLAVLFFGSLIIHQAAFMIFRSHTPPGKHMER